MTTGDRGRSGIRHPPVWAGAANARLRLPGAGAAAFAVTRNRDLYAEFTPDPFQIYPVGVLVSTQPPPWPEF